MKNTKNKKLIFLSRHAPNDGQIALAKAMGYEGIEQIDITFSSNPVKDLEEKGIKEKTISIVAPSYVTNKLLNEGYILIEFVNSPIKRERMVFCCEGAYRYKLIEVTKQFNEDLKYVASVYPDATACFSLPKRLFSEIEQEYIPCPLNIEEQVESSLVPNHRSREASK